MSGPAVTIVASGGAPVTPVDSGAPLVTAVDSGGVPITITDNATPLVIDGSTPPAPVWSNGIFVAGSNAFGWGFASPPLVSAPLGTLIQNPYTGSDMLSFWEAPDDSRVIVCFSGDIVTELTGFTFIVNGHKLNVIEPAEYNEEQDWTIMFLEPFWMIDGQAYVISRVPEE